jgi:hypothetical protein
VSFSDPYVMSKVETMSLFRDLMFRIIPPENRTEHNKHTHTFCQTVIAGYYSEIYGQTQSDMVSAVDFPVVTSYHLQEEPFHASQIFEPFNASVNRFMRYFERIAHRRCIFTTKAGHLGLGPLRVQRGDNVIVPLGSPSALILRAQSDGNFIMVGQAYCDGFMKGEALLGPVPDNWDLVHKFNEHAGNSLLMYTNRNTGVVQPEDPRLGELSTGWRRQPHQEEERWTKFVHDERGEILTLGRDLRLSSEALKDRGVELEYFII